MACGGRQRQRVTNALASFAVRPVRATVLVFTVIAATLALAAPAAACSAGPFDPRAATDLLIAGRVTAIEIAPTASRTGFRRTAVTVAVDAVLRGRAPGSVVTFVDDASAYVDPLGVVRFAGGSGACGVLDEDPTGRYVVIALKRAPDGVLQANRLYGAAFADGPTDPGLRWVLDRHLVSLPSTSTTGSVLPVAIVDPRPVTAPGAGTQDLGPGDPVFDPYASSVVSARAKGPDALTTGLGLAALTLVAVTLVLRRQRRPSRSDGRSRSGRSP